MQERVKVHPLYDSYVTYLPTHNDSPQFQEFFKVQLTWSVILYIHIKEICDYDRYV